MFVLFVYSTIHLSVCQWVFSIPYTMNKSVTQSIHAYTTTGQSVILKILLCMAVIAALLNYRKYFGMLVCEDSCVCKEFIELFCTVKEVKSQVR